MDFDQLGKQKKKIKPDDVAAKAKGGDEKAKAKVGSFFEKDAKDVGEDDMNDFAKHGGDMFEEEDEYGSGASQKVKDVAAIIDDKALASSMDKAEAICALLGKDDEAVPPSKASSGFGASSFGS